MFRYSAGRTFHGHEQMPIPERLPEVTDSLKALRALGVPVESVLDVGILHGTAGLMQVFPDV